MRDLYRFKPQFEKRLEQLLSPNNSDAWNWEIGTASPKLLEAMRYSLLAGGKRLRPMMFLTAIDLLGGSPEKVLDFACAIEMIHTYSLIHDDLPGMDNDTLRRGRKTNHVVFGEGHAILAGDGLLNYAYEVMLRATLTMHDQAHAVDAIAAIARGAGIIGMISGQTEDLLAEEAETVPGECLNYIQTNKTSCMFAYPLRAAGLLCNGPQRILDALFQYGTAYGLLFQAVDDILDVIGTAENLGKSIGKDAQEHKKTCVTVYGMEQTLQYIERNRIIAEKAAMNAFDNRASVFIDLLDQTVKRVS